MQSPTSDFLFGAEPTPVPFPLRSYLVFTPEKKIKYRSTWIAIIVCMVVTSIISLGLRVLLQRENTRRDARGEGEKDAINVQERQEENDETDGQNLQFRYSL